MNCVERMPMLYGSHGVPGSGVGGGTLALGAGAFEGSTENLSEYSSSVGSNCSFPEEYTSTEVPLKVVFEGRTHEIIADENLRATDLCHILALKLNLNRTSLSWSLWLQIPTEHGLQLERMLEEGEEVVAIYKKFQVSRGVLVLMPSLGKYDFLDNPSSYFPMEMVDVTDDADQKKGHQEAEPSPLTESSRRRKMNRLQHQLLFGSELRLSVSGPLKLTTGLLQSQSTPTSCSGSSSSCSVTRLSSDLVSEAKSAIAQITSCPNSSAPCNKLIVTEINTGNSREFDVTEYSIFAPISDSSSSKSSPSSSSFPFCLIRDSNIPEAESEGIRSVHYFFCRNEAQRTCWLTSLRLIRFGLKSLRNDLQQTRKGSDKCSKPGKGSVSPSSSHGYLDMDGKAVIDYTHKDGPKVIDDPKQVRQFAENEANEWRRRFSTSRSRTYSSSSSCSPSPASYSPSKAAGASSGQSQPVVSSSPAAQPWFYDNMAREEANRLLEKYSSVNGVFLVRNSNRSPGSFVLSFACNGKVNHVQIQRIDCENQYCLSLDCGKTKFYDLQQLVEFYQLNYSYLPTKLTHFVVHKTPHSH